MLFWLWFACSASDNEKHHDDGVDSGSNPETESIDPAPASARIFRLTDTQYRNKVKDLVGVIFEGELPIDYQLEGYVNIGASAVNITPLDLERYEQAAWNIATTRLPNQSALDDELTCALRIHPLDVAQGEPTYRSDCIAPWLTQQANTLWQRDIDGTEAERLLSVFDTIATESNTTLAAQGVLATLLLAPDFLYRIEAGEPDDDGKLRLSAFELAERLSYFLTNAPPDASLLTAVADNTLFDDSALEFHTRRLLATERAQDAMLGFFRQTIDIDKIEGMDKHAATYPMDSESLRTAMVQELEQLFLMAFDSGDFRQLLTSNQAFVTPELADLYGLSDIAETGWHPLPADQNRGGLLGRAGFLALNATAIRSSPTHRGKFIRTRLLCQDIPPPPEGVETSLDEIDTSLSLRDQLEQHMTDPSCSGCHMLMDPLGFPLEHFDAIGAWRSEDNGHPIDATGTLDGTDVDGAKEMGESVAAHNRFSYCMTSQLMRHSIGAMEGSKQRPYIDTLNAQFIQSGYQFKELVLQLVLSEPFRAIAGSLDGRECTTANEQRPCGNECGDGIETCIDGIWQGCNATPVETEVCDGIDQDCDGIVDELQRHCWASDSDGIQRCSQGEWGICERVTTAETCDGIDNDNDGQTDEGLSIETVAFTFDETVDSFEYCDPTSLSRSGPCNAAVHRYCYSQSCDWVSGFGILTTDAVSEKVSAVCMAATEGTVILTSFTELQTHFEWCFSDDPVTPGCNASINRFCNAQGLTTGYGPVEHSGDDAWVVCTPKAVVHQVSYDLLGMLNPECHWPVNTDSVHCNEAIHRWCESEGYKTGHGPLENYQNDAWVACLPHPEEAQ